MKRAIYFTLTYFICFIYLLIAIKYYSTAFNAIKLAVLFEGEAKYLAIKYGITSLIATCLMSFINKKHFWEIPLMIVLALIDIWGLSGMTAVIGSVLKYFGIYNLFIHQIVLVTGIVFTLNFIYGILSTRDLNNSKLMTAFGGICLVLILIINMANVRYRFLRIIVDVLILIWFSYGVAQDSQKTLKDYEKVSNNTEMWLYALENADFLCSDLIFVFGQLMNLVIDEKE